MKLKSILFAASLLAGACFLVTGCASQAPAPVQQQLSIATPAIQPPPTPPTKQELEKPPTVVLEKPTRDPFSPIPVVGTVVVAQASKSGKTGASPSESVGGYVVSGIILDGERSAIVVGGENSYIVHYGDVVDGYRVVSITSNEVVLVGRGGKLSLPLPPIQ